MSDICMGGWVVEGERRWGEWMMVVSRREGGAGRRWRERCGVKRLCGVYCQGRENLSGVVSAGFRGCVPWLSQATMGGRWVVVGSSLSPMRLR